MCVGSNMPDGPHEIECAFNPTDYTLTQTVSVPATTSAGQGRRPQQYGGTGALTFATNLFFDEFAEAKGDVTPKITTLLELDAARPTKSSSERAARRRRSSSSSGAATRSSTASAGSSPASTVNYTLFRMDGTPVRAEVAITLTGSQPDARDGRTRHRTRPNSRRVHTVIDGDTLQSVAYRELGKPHVLARDRRAQRHRRPDAPRARDRAS